MATTYDKASLVMIPSGVKEDKLYSIKPTNGDGDFTFSRGTDTATRVNSSGLIEKETSNLLLQSNTFDTTWATSNASVTGGQSGYDGSSDAWELSSTGGFLQQNISSSGVQTFSVYAKQGTLEGIRLRIDAGVDANCYINLTDGSEYFANTGIDLNVTSVGGGWWRISLTTAKSIINVRFYPLDNLGSSGTGTIYIQDAQLNQGLVAQDYLETTTAAVFGGVTDNLPRLDYSGGASCPSLLLEPSRTNSLAHSEYFEVSPYTSTFITLTANSAVSPEGLQNAYNFVPTTDATSNHRMYDGSGPSIQTATHSIFIKPNGHNYWALRESSTTGASIGFDFTDNSIIVEYSTGGCTASNGKIEPLENGWYRISGTFSFASATSQGFGLYAAAPTWTSGDVESVAWAGDGTSGGYIYGAQLEAGSYPTSYIPTYGTSQTRAADVCSKTGIASLIGQSEGTLFVEMDKLNDIDIPTITIDDNTNNNRILFVTELSTGNWGIFRASSGSAAFSYGTTSGVSGKFALAYSSAGYSLYRNGVEIATLNATLPASLSSIRLNGRSTNDLFGIKGVKQALLFKTRLTNAELAALTSL